jgi:RNA polymerase sigma factor (sigma-70 family)
MRALARRIAPGRSDFWEDMIQAGYLSIWKSAGSYRPGGGSFGGYAFPMVVHSMRREFHKACANEMGKCLNLVIRGEGDIDREYLSEEAHNDAMQNHPGDGDIEGALLRAELSFHLRRAVWNAADTLGAVFVPWKNAVIRERILSNRSTLKEICDRFGKNRNSVYHFEKKLIALIASEMRGKFDYRG